MLRHIGKLPSDAGTTSTTETVDKPESADAQLIVRQFLTAMENRDLNKAQVFLDEGFTMTFPGGNTFATLSQLVEWSKTRYRSIGKTFERFDQSDSDTETVVYCYGTLNGVWLDGTTFSDVRFVDRFVVANGLLRSQSVWNDLAESLVN